MATFKSILTNKGLQLEAAAAASGVPMILTHMAIGDGNGNPVTPNPAQLTLARERYRHAVNRLVQSPTDPTMYLAELIIPADTGGFVMREVGLYSSNGDLFAVGNLPDTYKPLAAEGSFGDSVIKMFFKVANTGTVTIVFDPNVVVATHSWVMNNVNASTIIPGGLTGQLLSKKSNADGDTEWIDVTEGITVIVSSREETQTLAAGQTIIDLAEITAEGAAVYIEGTRLRGDEFSQTGPTQITLASSHPAGTKATVVQNEEVGSTDVLQRPLNLSDVPDKAAARNNLGLPNWLASSDINWNQLLNVPEYASRWAAWSEVTGKPTTFAPSAHQHPWADITGAPDTATRWPTWNEVTSKPSLFPPAAHSHPEDVKRSGDEMSGTLSFRGSGVASRRAKVFHNADASNDYGAKFMLDSSASTTDLGCVTIIPIGANGYQSQILLQLKSGDYFNAPVVNVVTVRTTGIDVLGTINPSGGYDFGSSKKLKDIDGPVPYGLAAVERMELAAGYYKPEYNDDGRRRLFFVAEQLAELVPEAVDMEGVEFNGERVPSIKLDQLLPVMAKAIQELAAEVRALKAGR